MKSIVNSFRTFFDRNAYICDRPFAVEDFSVKVFDEENGFVRFSFEIRSVGVIVIVNYEGIDYFLLVQQADRIGNSYEYPSGRVDNDQDLTPLSTAQREHREETGLQVDEIRLKLLDYKYKGWNYKTQMHEGAVQYILELNRFPGNWVYASRDDLGRIYFQPPLSVDKNEIAQLVLEPLRYLNKTQSLGITSKHNWANIIWSRLYDLGYVQLMKS